MFRAIQRELKRRWQVLRLRLQEDMLQAQLDHTSELVECYTGTAERLAWELNRCRNRLLALEKPEVLLTNNERGAT